MHVHHNLRSINRPRDPTFEIFGGNRILSSVKVLFGVQLFFESIDHQPTKTAFLASCVDLSEIAKALIGPFLPCTTSIKHKVIDAQIEVVTEFAEIFSNRWIAKTFGDPLQLKGNQYELRNSASLSWTYLELPCDMFNQEEQPTSGILIFENAFWFPTNLWPCRQ